MNKKRKRIILVMDWFDSHLQEGVLEYASQNDWEIIGSHHQPYKIPKARGDGLLIVPGLKAAHYHILEEYKNFAVVMHAIPTKVKVPYVLPDIESMGRMAAEHLLEHGFRNLAVLRLWTEPFAEPAVVGFTKRVAEEGLPVHSALMPGQDNRPEDERSYDLRLNWLAEQIRNVPKPAGVFLPIDSWASQALRACRMANLDVPESVAVLGMNNTTLLCEYESPPLSSIDPNMKAIGFEAARLLDRRMAGDKIPAKAYYIAPKGVKARRSTDSLAIPDLRVAKAIRFIRDHLNDRPSCRDVANFTGVNLRTLQAAFHRNIARGIGGEILYWRIESIKRSLRETNKSTQQIAYEHNYSSVFVLYRQFKSQTGMTMRQYRNQLQNPRKTLIHRPRPTHPYSPTNTIIKGASCKTTKDTS